MNLNTTTISIVKRLLGGRNSKPLKAILKRLEVQELSKLFTILNDRELRLFVDALMSIDRASQALTELPPPQLVLVVEKIELPKLLTLLSYCPEDDAVYILGHLQDVKQSEVLDRLSSRRQSRLRQLLSYQNGSAGRDMQTEVFALPMVLNCQEAIDRIRARAENESVYYIYCVDEDNTLVGVVSLRELVAAPAAKPLREIMKKDLITVRPDTTSEEVARLVSQHDYIALPVTTEAGELLGLVTVDNVIDIIQSQAAAQIYAQAGLQERDRIYTPARQSAFYRLPWMILNLATAFTASAVVAQFEETMSKLIVLASLNNIVAGMGGNQAIQTLTVTTRGLATGDFNFITQRRAFFKELTVGLINGLLVGTLGGLVVYLWKGQAGVAGILFCAMIINSLIATGMGASVPVLMKRLGFDPTSGSGVVVTFATDVCGFLAFLGIATFVLRYFSHL